MGRTAVLGATALMSLGALAGCGSSDSDSTTSTPATTSATTAATTAAKKPTNIAFISGSYTDFNQVEEQGLKAVVEPDGGKVQVFNAQFDPAKMLQQCNDAISSGRFNAIVIEADPTGGPPCVQAAAAAKIPVVQLDVPLPDVAKSEPQLDGVVGSAVLSLQTNIDNTVKLVTDACEGIDPCKVAAEITSPPDTYYGPAIDAVKKIPNVEVVQTIAGMFDPSVIAQKMPDVLTAHPDLNVFLSTADSQALAAMPAIEQAGMKGKVKVIGNGGSRLGTQAVADGTLFGSQGNWPKQGAEAAAKMAVQAVNGEPVDPQVVDVSAIDQPLLLTKETVGQFKPEWGAERGGE